MLKFDFFSYSATSSGVCRKKQLILQNEVVLPHIGIIYTRAGS